MANEEDSKTSVKESTIIVAIVVPSVFVIVLLILIIS
jgi:hypothetical protein